MSLNSSQQEVANFKQGIALVVAVAGSGKTKTMIARTLELINSGVDPAKIWLTTFTNKAAKEIKDRLFRENPLAQHVQVGTFHGFCLRWYKQFVGQEKDTTVIDQDDVEQAIKMIIANDTKYSAVSNVKPRTIYDVLSYATNTCSTIVSALNKKAPSLVEFINEFQGIKQDYENFKMAQSLIDFDDILVKVIDFLNGPDSFVITTKCEYLIVDEFQDTNRLQFELIKALITHHKNLMCVGDDAQSIYSFRGANPKQLEEFMDSFPDLKIFKLEKNYRSLQGILDVGNHTLDQMGGKIKKKLISANYEHDKSGVSYIEVPSESDQVAYLISQIKKAPEPSDICVLVKYGYQSALLEVKLLANKIPYIKYGGLKFLEKKHIKDVISFLKLKVNSKDQLAALRCFGMLPGIGTKSAQAMFEKLSSSGSWAKSMEKVKDKSNPIYALLKDFDTTSNNLATLISAVVLAYTPYLEKQAETKEKLNSQRLDLTELVRVAEEYTSINSFISDVILGESAIDPKEATGSVLISTIHSIKGLERPHVLIPNVYEGVYPRYSSTEEEEEEEKRLFYVAVTRAKSQLTLIKPYQNARGERTIKSAFIPHGLKSTYY